MLISRFKMALSESRFDAASASLVHWNLAMMISPCLGVPDVVFHPTLDDRGDTLEGWLEGWDRLVGLLSSSG